MFYLERCMFRRDEDSGLEPGLYVGNEKYENGVIIDEEYHLCNFLGVCDCFFVPEKNKTRICIDVNPKDDIPLYIFFLSELCI